jgi:Spy/CpxP family protein refolding chaperone
MSRRVYLYFALTFLLGAILGASGVFFYAWYTGHWHRGPNRERVVRRLKNELNLSPTQVQQLRQIMDEEGKRFENLQKQAEPQYQAIREETGSRIRQILSPEQAVKFNDMVRRWDERRRHRTH